MDIHAFLSSSAGLAAQGVLAAAFLDFAFGVFAAVKDGTFQVTALAAFVQKHLVGRVFPIASLLVVGYLSGNMAMNAAAAAAALAYTAETLGSIYQSLTAPAAANIVPTA